MTWKKVWLLCVQHFSTLTDTHIVLGIFLFAVALHLPGLKNSFLAAVNYDDGRDVLIASHILRNGEFPLRGPYAAGGLNILDNSPLYFYIVALFHLIGGYTLTGTYVIWIIISSLSISLLYKVIRRIWDDRFVAFACTLLACFHPLYFAISSMVAQPYLLPVLTTSMLLLLFKPAHTLRDVIFMIILLSLGVHIHLSMLLLTPVIGIWIGVTTYRLYIRNDKSIIVLLWPIAITFISVVYWLVLTFRQNVLDQMDFLQTATLGGFGETIDTFPRIINTWIDLVVGINRHNTPITIGIAVLLVAGMMLYELLVAKKANREQLYWLALLFVTPLYYSVFYRGDILGGYFMVLLPIIVVIAAGILKMILRMNLYGGIALVFAVGFLFAGQIFVQIPEARSVVIYESMQEISRAIIDDQKMMTGKSGTGSSGEFWTAFVTSNPSALIDTWQTGSLWYMLERGTGSTFVRVVDIGTNFTVRNRHPKYLYIACDVRVLRMNSENDDCGYWMDQASQKYGLPSELLMIKNPYMLYRAPLTDDVVKLLPDVF